MDTFATDLDKKVHVQANDPRYEAIYKDIDTIVKRLCERLKYNHPYYENAYVRRTGSIEAGVKVGLPHETDYLLYVPEPIRNDQLLDLLHENAALIVNNSLDELTLGLHGKWIIRDVKKHHVGICLVMEYRAVKGNKEPVGVTTDIVSVVEYNSVDDIFLRLNKFTSSAQAYLPHTMEEYVGKGMIYRLASKGSYDDIDTGQIENDIIKDLPEGIKRGFRLAKYLTQFCIYDNHELNHEPSIIIKLDKREYTLFGYEPRIKSYHIRVCLLHLLIQSAGHRDAIHLTDSVLALCLLKMYRYRGSLSNKIGSSYPFFHHPLLKRKTVNLHNFDIDWEWRLSKLDEIVETFATKPPLNDIDKCSLLNLGHDCCQNTYL